MASLQVVLDGNSSQEYPLNAGVSQCFIPSPALFLLYINDLPDDVMCISRTWIWPMRHCGLGQEVACWFQYSKTSTGFVWWV